MKLPESWVETTLGEIAEIVGGGTPDRNNPAYFGGEIPWVTPSDVSNLESVFLSATQETITEEGLKNSATNLIPANSVLLATRVAVGKVGLTTQPTAINQDFAGLICNKQIINSEYLAKFITSRNEFLLSRSQGSTIKGITRDNLKRVKILLPTLAEQQRIVAILNEAETLTDSYRQIKNTWSNFLPSLFFSMFGNPVINEKQYPQKLLADVCSCYGGGTPEREKVSFWGGDIPWVSPKDMKDFVINSAEESITEHAIKNSATKKIPEGSVLVVTRSGILQKELPVAWTVNEVAINQDLKAFIPGNEVNGLFLAAQLKVLEPYFLSQVRQGATVHNIETERLFKAKIILPDRSKQDEFAKIYCVARTIFEATLSQIKKFNELSLQLSHFAFLGELTESWRVKNEKQIKAEAEARAERLALTAKPRTPEKPPAAAKKSSQAQSRPARLALFGELSEFQRFVFDALHEWPAGILIPDDSAAFEEFCRQWPVEHERNTQDRARRALDQLAALGLIAKVSLPNPQGQYLTVYRMLREGDERRTADIAAIGRSREPA